MARRTGLQTGVASSLALTPGMRLGLELLRMSPVELLDRIGQEAETNPLLLVEDRSVSRSLSGPSLDMLQDTLAQPVSLTDHLMQQIGMMGVSSEIRAVAQYLCGNLDDDGYLSFSRAELAFDLRCDLDLVDSALQALRACDPAGVGARSLRDCLALQLVRRDMSEERAYRIVGALEPLMSGDWAAARAVIGGTDAELTAVAALVRTLDPRPGQSFTPMVREILLPDLRVSMTRDGKLTVALAGDWMPRLSIDTDLCDRGLRDKDAADSTETLLESAQSLIRAVEYRGYTVRRVGVAVVSAQERYFSGQIAFPQPLSRQDIANTLNLHPSTIGRAVRGRALEFGGQVIPLERFFPAPATGEGSNALPATVVRQMIGSLIADESTDAVLSDDDIAQKLQEEGVDIKRRSVAKYRKCMSIPSSHVRKRLIRRRADP